MTVKHPQDYHKLLHQIHSEVFLERLRDCVDPDNRSKVLQEGYSDLTARVQHLINDSPSSIDKEAVEKILVPEEGQNDLWKATRNLLKNPDED